MPRKGSIGTSMGGTIESKASKRRKARRRRREEAEWRTRNGPVTITYLPGREPRDTQPDLRRDIQMGGGGRV